jgi:molybdenum cofactor biosynthesis enzyme MoaA
MINKLEDIGFYTITNNRCRNASETSDLQRCEILLTGRCSFKCPYCRGIGGPDMPYSQAENVVRLWASQKLKNIRFSGGEPTLYPGIVKLVLLAKELGCERVAISSNGSASKHMYDSLLEAGCTDFSISLDACCASDGDIMSGTKGQWDKIVSNIKYLSSKTYVTVGVVLTNDNADKVNDIITFADSLGVSDIRIIPAAQDGDRLKNVFVSTELLDKYPILKYRIENLQEGKPVRGLSESDTNKCGLVLDDMAVCEGKHYPCIIYLREGGRAIGNVGPNMRKERLEWYKNHDTKKDIICSKSCLDVCVEYCNKFEEFHNE